MTLHQCLNVEVHPPHDFCPGLDGTEVPPPAHDPLTVRCPSCMAPPAHPCGDEPHADRLEAARHAAAVAGTCGLCGQLLHRLTDPDDALHLDPADEAACPPLPNPRHDFDAYQAAIHEGARPGHPGVEHWHPIGEPTPPALWCPECTNGKHVNCVGQAMHPVTDELVPCSCTHEVTP